MTKPEKFSYKPGLSGQTKKKDCPDHAIWAVEIRVGSYSCLSAEPKLRIHLLAVVPGEPVGGVNKPFTEPVRSEKLASISVVLHDGVYGT